MLFYDPGAHPDLHKYAIQVSWSDMTNAHFDELKVL